MNRHRNVFSAILAIGLIFFASLAQVKAQRSQVNEREVRSVLRQLTVKLDDFQYNLDYELRQNSANQTDEEDLRNSLDQLQTEVNNFQNKFTRRRDSQQDVSQILASAETVDENLARLRLNQKLKRDWTSTRQLLDQLATNYGVRGGDSNNNDDNSQLPPDNQSPTQTTRNNSFSYGLTGTYQLDASRSENARDVAERAITNGTSTQNRDEARRDLEEKLEAPERLAIDVQGNQVTLASTLAPQVTFTADGRDRTETLADGRTLRVRDDAARSGIDRFQRRRQQRLHDHFRFRRKRQKPESDAPRDDRLSEPNRFRRKRLHENRFGRAIRYLQHHDRSEYDEPELSADHDARTNGRIYRAERNDYHRQSGKRDYDESFAKQRPFSDDRFRA